MVAISKVREDVSALVHSRPLVAVVIGGTSGVGENTIRELATVHGESGPGLRIYIVGRNKDAASQIIAFCRQKCPKGDFIFVQCMDLSLIKDVDKTCNEIMRFEGKQNSARIDLLYFTPNSLAILFEKSFEVSEEGLLKASALAYYSRVRALLNLMPLLKASSMPAHFVSVFGAGLEKGGTFREDDLSASKAVGLDLRATTVRMMTLFLEALSETEPNCPSLIHVNPGFNLTPLFRRENLPWWFRTLFFLFTPIFRFMAYTPEDNGQRMLYMATPNFPARGEGNDEQKSRAAVGTDGVRGSGRYEIEDQCEPVAKAKMDEWYPPLRSRGLKEKAYAHTLEALESVASGKRFSP